MMDFFRFRFLITLLLLTVCAVATPVSQDSVRREVAGLSAQGKLEAALELVENSSLPASTSNLLGGKLELSGATAQKKFEAIVKDVDASPAARGEALFRLGQLHYAGGQYRMAIPQFRQYISEYPRGPWADPASYWMAYSCLQFSIASHQKPYLDTGLHYLERFKPKKSNEYYRPLALTARARTLITRSKRGDTTLALVVLGEAERHSPSEEMPGVLLLASKALENVRPDEGKLLEDSLIWNYPFSPEAGLVNVAPQSTRFLSTPEKSASKSSTASGESLRYTLQLGKFSVAKNAEELRKRLALKGIHVLVQEVSANGESQYRVFYGNFPDVASARKNGARIFKPLAVAFQVAVLRS